MGLRKRALSRHSRWAVIRRSSAGAPGASVHRNVLRCLQSLSSTWPDSLLGLLGLKSFYLLVDVAQFLFLFVHVIFSAKVRL